MVALLCCTCRLMCSQAQLAEELGWDRPEGWCSSSAAAYRTRPTWRGWCCADGEIVSATFRGIAQAREKVAEKVKLSLADRLGAALDAVEQGVTALCEAGAPGPLIGDPPGRRRCGNVLRSACLGRLRGTPKLSDPRGRIIA